MNPLAYAADHARPVLMAGLAAGILLPDLAGTLSLWLPQLVIGIIFLAALRLSPGDIRGLFSNTGKSLGLILILQLALPLCVLAVVYATGQQNTPLALVLILFASAPPILGSPNLSAIMGLNAALAMQILIIGTVLLPLTVLPVFWLLPALGAFENILYAALRLFLSIMLAGTGALVVRRLVLPRPTAAAVKSMDGASVIGLSVVVIALMPAVAGAATSNTSAFALWFLAALVVNFGTQIAAYHITRTRMPTREAGTVSFIAGNRNIALFFTALPPEITAPLLVFLGCYQVPMFFTPIVMRRFYAR